jgi:hypothetical protein
LPSRPRADEPVLLYGKVLRNIDEVRRAVGKFVEDYNAEWRVHMLMFGTLSILFFDKFCLFVVDPDTLVLIDWVPQS